MKRWITAILVLTLLFQAVPMSSFADSAADRMITDGELTRALQIAGLQTADGSGAAANGLLQLEGKQDGYHAGMMPDSTWDAGMLVDWLDEKLSRDLYSVTDTYTRADSRLQLMKTDDPATYAYFTESVGFAGFEERCHHAMLEAEAMEEKARFLRASIVEEAELIENNAERLANQGNRLFDSEKARISEQIRQASNHLTDLRGQVLAMMETDLQRSALLQQETLSESDQAYSRWLSEVCASGETIQQATLSAEAIQTAGTGTLISRLSAPKRALSEGDSQDVVIQVINKNEFAVEIHGVDNQPVGGVKVTVRDLNGNTELTAVTDADLGSVVFDANQFVNDFDYTMELAMTVDAEAAGYRSFYIPWLLMTRGEVRRETLTLLTGPETKEDRANGTKAEKEALAVAANEEGKTEPYVYACQFNGQDIMRQDFTTHISPLNDADIDIRLTVAHGEGEDPGDPVLYYRYYNYKNKTYGDASMKPTSRIKVDGKKTEYVYTRKWKQYLQPEIEEDARPYFVIPSTGKIFRTKLVPVRSRVDQPIYTGQEAVNPFSGFFSKGFGVNFELPKIGGKLGFNLPFDQYLPRVEINPIGYVTAYWGTQFVEPEHPENWKNTEANRYDRVMKRFEHKMSVADMKKAWTEGKEYSKTVTAKDIEKRSRLDVGFYVMGSGRVEVQEDEKGIWLWGLSAMFGFNVTYSQNYTIRFFMGVPWYVDFGFAISAGFGLDGIHFTWRTDREQGILLDHQFDILNSFTLTLRLMVHATAGVGVKGVASIWVSATGMVDFIFNFNRSAPDTFRVYLQATISVGGEIFWVKYSRVVWSPGPVMVVDEILNQKVSGHSNLAASSSRSSSSNDEPRQTEVALMEPEHYPVLAPDATTVAQRVGSQARVIRYQNYEYLFDNARSEYYPGLTVRNLSTERGKASAGPLTVPTFYAESFFTENNLNVDDYTVYDYDVYNDGARLHLLMTMAKSFDQDGKPVPGGTDEAPNIVLLYLEFEGTYDDEGNEGILQLKTPLLYRWIVQYTNGISPICSLPHIDGVQMMDGKPIVFGSLFGQNENVRTTEFNTFAIEPERTDAEHPNFVVYGDLTVGVAYNDQVLYHREALNTSLRNWLQGDKRFEAAYVEGRDDEAVVPSLGFVSLETPYKPQYPSEESYVEQSDSYITLYEYYANYSETEVRRERDYLIGWHPRFEAVVARGKIGAYEVLQMSDGVTDPSLSIFYTQKEETEEREAYRLKGVYVSPRKGTSSLEVSYDIVQTDYDLTLSTSDFQAVTIGVSQYLYWLTAVGGEDEQKVWRISGVYYDQETRSVSDEMVIAEFTLPEIEHRGQLYKAVPQQITLTGDGLGYIIASPLMEEDENGSSTQEAVNVLYRFPTALMPHLSMQKAGLTETTVLQGDFVHCDYSMLSDGNMGISSFDVDVVLLENGWEKKTIETLHADLLVPSNSTLVLHGDRDEVVAAGEEAVLRSKDFIYSPRQHDWLLSSEGLKLIYKKGIKEPDETIEPETRYVSTNVLVPGVSGAFSGAIKIPEDWHGRYSLRLKITKYSSYTNWLSASALAQSHPELFRPETLLTANDAASNREILSAQGITRLDYVLDPESGKMRLQNAANFTAGGDGVSLYALEADAPESTEIICDVHDIQVDHRLREDYYGEKVLDIILHDYYQSNQDVELTCAMYLDNSSTPVYISLPYDPAALSADRTTTISVPLSALFDPAAHRSARFVFTAKGITETAEVNNEFTIYPGSVSPMLLTQDEEPPEEEVPIPPATGDSFSLWLYLVLAAAGLGTVMLMLRRRGRREKID